MTEDDAADIISETLEIFILQILYLRDVYPVQIFKKSRFYNAPVFVSILPTLNDYLKNVLLAVRKLQVKKEIFLMEIVLHGPAKELIEIYTFEINSSTKLFNLRDEFLLDFEEQLRKSLYTLAERLHVLNKLPNDVQFSIQLQTTQNAHIVLSQTAQFQDFPWLEDTADIEEKSCAKTKFIPILRLNALGITAKANLI